MTVFSPSTPPASCTTTSVLPATEASAFCSEAAMTALLKTLGSAMPRETIARLSWRKLRRLIMAGLLAEMELRRAEHQVGQAAQLVGRQRRIGAATVVEQHLARLVG